MIKKRFDKKSKFYKMIVSAPDGRFASDIREGGLTLKTVLFEAKKLSELGMIVDIFNSFEEAN